MSRDHWQVSTCVASFNPKSKFMRYCYIIPFYGVGVGSERLNNLPKIMELVDGQTVIQIQVFFLSLFIFERQRETECEWGKRGEGDTESKAGSRL